MKVLITLLISLLTITSCSAAENTVRQNASSPLPFSSDSSDERARLYDPTREDIIESQSLFIRGIAQFEMDNLEAALDYLLSAQSLNPDNQGIHYALLDVYLELNDLTNALYHGRRAIKKEPDNKWFRLKLSETYRKLGNISAAIEQIHAILEHHPNDVDILYLLASIQARQGRYAESNKVYDRLLELTGSERTVHFQKFQNFNNMGKPDSAIVELEHIRRLAPGNLNTLHTLSQFYLENNQPDEARKVLEDAVERNPRDPETLVSLSDIHLSQGEWEKGGNILISLVGDTIIDPVNKAEIVQYMLTRLNQDPNNEEFHSVVKTMIDTMVAIDYDFGLSHALAAEFYSLTENYSRALDHLESTTNHMPDNDAAWRQRLQLLYMENRYDETIVVGLQADEHVPDDALIQFFVGGAYFLKDDLDNAVKWLRSASEMPSRATLKSIILGTLGDAYASEDRWQEADKAYQEALNYDSRNDVTLNNYAYYLAERDLQIEEAMEMAKKALAIRPNNAAYLDTMGWIYFKMGDYERAKEYIQASINTGDASAEVMEHMGDVYEKLGDMEKARHWWQKALDKDETRTHLQEKLT